MKKVWIPTTLSSLLGLGLAAGLLWGCQDFLHNSDNSSAQGKEPDTTSGLVARTAAFLPFRSGPDPRTHCAALYELTDGQGATYAASPERNEWVGPAWNDKISSVTVAKGCVITLYVDSKYRGSRRNYHGPDIDDDFQTQKLYASLGSGPWGFNDTFSSYACSCEDRVIGNNAGTAWDEEPGRGPARKILWYGPRSDQSMVPLKFNDRPGYIQVNPYYEAVVYNNVAIHKGRAVGSGGGQKFQSSKAVDAPLNRRVSLISAYRPRAGGCNNPGACYMGTVCNPQNYITHTNSAERCFTIGFSYCQPSIGVGPATCEEKP